MNYHNDFRRHVSIMIPAEYLSLFPPNPDSYYRNTAVLATGRIRRVGGYLRQVITSPSGLEVTGERDSAPASIREETVSDHHSPYDPGKARQRMEESQQQMEESRARMEESRARMEENPDRFEASRDRVDDIRDRIGDR